jgi:hypothetical protein
MRDLRWRAASIKLCDVLSGASFALFLVYMDGAFAIAALITLLASMMLDAGEPRPGDPPRRRRT